MLRALSMVVAVVISGCGGGSSESGSAGACSELNLRVSNGEQCTVSASPVVMLVTELGSGLVAVCSATMVSSDDALTAAHCLEQRGTGERVVFAGGAAYRVVNERMHPLYSGTIPSPHDLAMVTLERSPGLPAVPIGLTEVSAIGDQVTVFGYGESGEEEDQQGLAGRELRAAYLQIGQKGAGLIAASFEESGSAICLGDSGGPVIRPIDGIPAVIGVSSFNVNGCSDGSISGFADLQLPDAYDFVFEYAPDAGIK